MARIVISTNSSLDGIVQDPDGREGTEQGGWFGRSGGADIEPLFALLLQEALGAEALLLGRRTDRWFAERWLTRTGAFADRLNGMPKYVVSSTLENPEWNSTVLHGDVVEEVSKLKQRVGGDIVVFASGRLVHTLMEHDLVDELRLMIYPFVLGGGERLFGETTDRKPLRLIAARTVGHGLNLLTYQPVRR